MYSSDTSERWIAMKMLALLPLVLLVACGTPQQQCISRETRDLRTLDRLIAETQGNIDRGYALQEVTVYRDRWVMCRGEDSRSANGDPQPSPRLCLDDYADTETRPRAINLAEEADKLRSMRAKRTTLARAAESVVSQCRALYPE